MSSKVSGPGQPACQSRSWSAAPASITAAGCTRIRHGSSRSAAKAGDSGPSDQKGMIAGSYPTGSGAATKSSHSRCRVASNPHQLGLDEGTFRGLLRHSVRFHVGEFLAWGVLDEADVNWSAAEEMWRMCWRVPVQR